MYHFSPAYYEVKEDIEAKKVDGKHQGRLSSLMFSIRRFRTTENAI